MCSAREKIGTMSYSEITIMETVADICKRGAVTPNTGEDGPDIVKWIIRFEVCRSTDILVVGAIDLNGRFRANG